MSACRLVLATLPELEAEIAASRDGWLAEEDAARATAIAAPLRRRQFLAGRWLARRMGRESAASGAGPWRVAADHAGRRRLLRGDDASAWISLSHSGDVVACALGDAPLGVDVEFARRPRDLPALAREVFAPEEVEALATLEGAAHVAAFYRLWTQKEAEGKRSGAGLQRAHARGFVARSAAIEGADARSWSLPEGALTLCCERGARVTTDEGLAASPSSSWSFQPS